MIILHNYVQNFFILLSIWFLFYSLMLAEMLAVECKLAQVKPASDNKWLDEATEWFRSHTLNKDFIAQVRKNLFSRIFDWSVSSDLKKVFLLSINPLLPRICNVCCGFVLWNVFTSIQCQWVGCGLTNGQTILYNALQIYSVVHKIMRVKLMEVESGDFLSVNRRLIDLQYAVKAEEYYLSKVCVCMLPLPHKGKLIFFCLVPWVR